MVDAGASLHLPPLGAVLDLELQNIFSAKYGTVPPASSTLERRAPCGPRSALPTTNTRVTDVSSRFVAGIPLLSAGCAAPVQPPAAVMRLPRRRTIPRQPTISS